MIEISLPPMPLRLPGLALRAHYVRLDKPDAPAIIDVPDSKDTFDALWQIEESMGLHRTKELHREPPIAAGDKGRRPDVAQDQRREASREATRGVGAPAARVSEPQDMFPADSYGNQIVQVPLRVPAAVSAKSDGSDAAATRAGASPSLPPVSTTGRSGVRDSSMHAYRAL